MTQIKQAIDTSKLKDIHIEGIDFRDAPDFVDAYIYSASIDGRELTETELEQVNSDADFIYQCVLDKIY